MNRATLRLPSILWCLLPATPSSAPLSDAVKIPRDKCMEQKVHYSGKHTQELRLEQLSCDIPAGASGGRYIIFGPCWPTFITAHAVLHRSTDFYVNTHKIIMMFSKVLKKIPIKPPVKP